MYINNYFNYNLINNSNDIMIFNEIDEFFIKESFDIIQDILKKFNIDIFFNIMISDIDINLEPLNMYFKLKNKDFYCYIYNHYLTLNYVSISNHILFDDLFDLQDFYIILNYIKNNLSMTDYMFHNYMIISDNENNVKQFKDFLLKQYNIKISIRKKIDEYFIIRNSNEKYYEIRGFY